MWFYARFGPSCVAPRGSVGRGMRNFKEHQLGLELFVLVISLKTVVPSSRYWLTKNPLLTLRANNFDSSVDYFSRCVWRTVL